MPSPANLKVQILEGNSRDINIFPLIYIYIFFVLILNQKFGPPSLTHIFLYFPVFTFPLLGVYVSPHSIICTFSHSSNFFHNYCIGGTKFYYATKEVSKILFIFWRHSLCKHKSCKKKKATSWGEVEIWWRGSREFALSMGG